MRGKERTGRGEGKVVAGVSSKCLLGGELICPINMSNFINTYFIPYIGMFKIGKLKNNLTFKNKL